MKCLLFFCDLQIADVFYYAQKAVLHPTAPLFDQETRTLKPRCVRALKRIFMLCDRDKDGALNDAELNDFQVPTTSSSAPQLPDVSSKAAEDAWTSVLTSAEAFGFIFWSLQEQTFLLLTADECYHWLENFIFSCGGSQVKCFNAPLQLSEIDEVKNVVSEKMAEGVNVDGLTLTGFLFLHALFIEKGRLETTWTVLGKYGYDDEIKLRDDLLQYPSFKRCADAVTSCTFSLYQLHDYSHFYFSKLYIRFQIWT